MGSRRQFCVGVGALLGASALIPGVLEAQVAATRVNVGDHDRALILGRADAALGRKVELTGDPESQGFLDFTLDMGALAAANLIAPDPRFSIAAARHLRAWLGTQDRVGGHRLPAALSRPGDVVALAGMAEVAVALPSLGLDEEASDAAKRWFREALAGLAESRTGGLARDSKDHEGGCWLLEVAAYARLLEDEARVDEAQHRFKTVTLRAEIDSSGGFPHEVTTADPFRNSLFALDLLGGVCQLLSTKFDSLWERELQDGPGMRTAVAHHVPFLSRPATWPYPADESHFHDLPGRRPVLLFAARAFQQAEYAALWRELTPAIPGNPELLRAFPIRWPSLWMGLGRGLS